MSVYLEYSARLGDYKRKFSLASMASTSAGDTSSDPSTDELPHVEMPVLETQYVETSMDTFTSHAGGDDLDLDSPFPVTYFDSKDMPFARALVPEPRLRKANHEDCVAKQIRGHGYQFLPEPSMDYMEHYMNKDVAAEQFHMQPWEMHPLAQIPRRVVVIPVPVLVPSMPEKPAGLSTNANQPPLSQPNTWPSSSSSSLPLAAAPAQEEPPPEKEQPAPQAASKKNGSTVKSAANPRSQSLLDTLPAEKKDQLCKYIYDVMVQKSLTSTEGYLIIDVFAEVWKDMNDSADGSRVAQQRFADLLRSAPQYFKLFRRNIQVANQCGWFARKGEKMVRLVLDGEKK
jgi:hypothetical protein